MTALIIRQLTAKKEDLYEENKFPFELISSDLHYANKFLVNVEIVFHL